MEWRIDRRIPSTSSPERLALIALWAAVVGCAIFSLGWRSVHDAPILVYIATLMRDCHAVPYRDVFDMNLPGTYAAFRAIIAIFGTSDLGLRLADLTIITGGLGGLFRGMLPWGRRVAGLGVGLAGLGLFYGTWAFSLQRELLALLPLGLLFAWGMRTEQCRWADGLWLGAALSGLMLLKPQLVLLGVPLAVLLVANCEKRRLRCRFILMAGFGFSFPLLVTAGWLFHNNAWDSFIEMVRYWPLYGEMNGDHVVVPLGERLAEIACRGVRMCFSAYTAVAAVALAVGYRAGVLSRKHLVCWFALIGVAILIPCFSGQFWRYHRLPFYMLTLSAAGFLFCGLKGSARRLALLAALSLIGVWSALALPKSYSEAFVAGAVQTEKGGVPDRFASYLTQHLKPEDRVQPIGWTGGAVHGMLQAGAKPATRFLYTFHFYHHVQHPLIQKLRREFLSALLLTPPRFLLESVGDRKPAGLGTAEHFEAFDQWRDERYHVVEAGERYRIWEKKARD